MNKKLFLIFVPIVLVPYLVLFGLSTIFFSTKLPLFHWIIESVFGGNALHLIAALLLYCIFITVLSVVCFIVSIHAKWDALLLAKLAMIIKLVQMPAYGLILALGVIFILSIFTIPFSIGLFIFSCLSVFMTGLFVISSVIITIKKNIFAFNEVFWVILLQFVFCADVISSVGFYIKLKRIYHQEKTQNDECARPNDYGK